MGYYTTFDIQVVGREKRLQSFANDLNAEAGFSVFSKEQILEKAKNGVLNTYLEAKWYEWEENFLTVCKSYPEIRITIEGKGEDNGDWWYCEIENRKSLIRKAAIIPPWDSEIKVIRHF